MILVIFTITAILGSISKQRIQLYDPVTKAYIFSLSPKGSLWSGQYMIPKEWKNGLKRDLRIIVKDRNGTILAKWPGFTIE